MEDAAREPSEAGGGGDEEMGDRGDRLENCAALLRAVPAYERIELPRRGVYILRGHTEPGVLPGQSVAGCLGPREEAAEIPREVSHRVPCFESERDGSPTGKPAQVAFRRVQKELSGTPRSSMTSNPTICKRK